MAITAEDVLNWTSSGSGEHMTPGTNSYELLERVVSAVTAHVARTHTEPDGGADDWDQAILMQSARLWDRRNSPNGIGGFGEFGAVRVTRLDPDVAALLEPFKVWAFA